MSMYIIDDHPLVRQAVAMLLRRMRPTSKVVELDKFSELPAAVIKNGDPELFVLDLLLPGVKGTSAVKEIKSLYADVPLAVISSMPAGEAEETCIDAGADIYIEKSSSPNEISSAIQGLFAAESNSEEEPANVVGETKLSKRQKQLIIMLDRGLSNREIATELNISEHTVKVHLWRLFRRLDVKSRTQTLHYARVNGLL